MVSVQKKIRDLERLARKKASNSSEDHKELRKRIEDLHSTRTQNKQHLREKKFSEKYHMVKFFERQKVVRKIRQLDKKIQKFQEASDSQDATEEKWSRPMEEMLQQRSLLEDDLTYICYYPKNCKYVGLFPSGEFSETETAYRSTEHYESMLKAARSAREEETVDLGKSDRVENSIFGEMETARKPSTKRKRSDDVHVVGQNIDGDENVGNGSYSKKRHLPSEENSQEAKQSSQPVASTSLPPSSVLPTDAFFLSSDSTADAETNRFQPALSVRIPMGSMHRNTGRPHRGSATLDKLFDEGKLTKQELRLAKWQEKARSKHLIVSGRSEKKRKHQ